MWAGLPTALRSSIMIIEEVYKEHLRFGVGAFLMPETEKEGCT